MGRDAAAHPYGIVGVVMAFYAISLWSLSQGGNAISEIPGLDPRAPVVSAYFGIMFIGVMLSLTSSFAIVHARATTDPAQWKLPIIGLGDAKIENPKAVSTCLYVGFLFTFILLIPAGSLIQLNKQLAGEDGRIWNEALPASAIVSVGCMMPRFWPFGTCPTDDDTVNTFIAVQKLSGGKKEDARLWLANHQCDVQWHMRMTGPQVEARMKAGGNVLSPQEELAWDNLKTEDPRIQNQISILSRLDFNVATVSPPPEYCAGPEDRSDICKETERCRGDQWLPMISPFAVIAATLLGWGSFLWLILIELLWSLLFPKKPVENRNAE